MPYCNSGCIAKVSTVTLYENNGKLQDWPASSEFCDPDDQLGNLIGMMMEDLAGGRRCCKPVAFFGAHYCMEHVAKSGRCRDLIHPELGTPIGRPEVRTYEYYLQRMLSNGGTARVPIQFDDSSNGYQLKATASTKPSSFPLPSFWRRAQVALSAILCGLLKFAGYSAVALVIGGVIYFSPCPEILAILFGALLGLGGGIFGNSSIQKL